MGVRHELEGHLSCFSCLFQAPDPHLGLLDIQTPFRIPHPGFQPLIFLNKLEENNPGIQKS